MIHTFISGTQFYQDLRDTVTGIEIVGFRSAKFYIFNNNICSNNDIIMSV
jgi:hypothetical protein